MGLAASQARLLTITARLADNELKSQTINNAKMRLATQSSQASDEYISALNSAQLMFSNTDINGLARTQRLTYNNLTAYSQYNNQYALVNSAGLILVSEQDAAIYQAHKNDLEGFLAEYGLTWNTTYFDNPDGGEKSASTVMSDKLQSFYGTGLNSLGTHNLGDLFAGMSNQDLEDLYLRSLSEDAAIERLNYDKYAKEYYNEVKNLFENAYPAFRQQILGDSQDASQEDWISDTIAQLYSDSSNCPPGVGEELVRRFLLDGICTDPNGAWHQNADGTYSVNSSYNTMNIAGDGQQDTIIKASGNPYALNTLRSQGLITDAGYEQLSNMINSLADKTNGTTQMSGFMDQHFQTQVAGPVPAETFTTTDDYYYRNPNLLHRKTFRTDYFPGYEDLYSIDITGNMTATETDNLFRTEETDGRYGGKNNGYTITGMPGMTIVLDIPKMEDYTVTVETNQHNSSDTGWRTDSYDVQRQVPHQWETEVQFDNSGDVEYDAATQTAIQAWVDGANTLGRMITKSDFENEGTRTALMLEFAQRFEAYIGADNEGRSGDPSQNKIYFKWDDDKKQLYSIPYHEVEDTSGIPSGVDPNRYATYQLLIDEYFNILSSGNYFNMENFVAQNPDNPYLENFANTGYNFAKYDTNPVAGTRAGNGSLLTEVKQNPSYLMQFTTMLEGLGTGVYRSGFGSEAFTTVLETYLADLMLDVLGEPKYAWVDENDPASTQNSDAKAQWYENLFRRMQKGYKVLENGLASSPDWIEYAFESGLVTMEQVDKSFNWIGLDYKTCANIFENSDTSDIVAKAEATYNRAMNDIKQKDNMFDIQLKNIDTEHQSLQTEYDSIKGVINKNIERTMKFDQSA